MTTERARPSSLHAVVLSLPLVLWSVSFVFDLVSIYGGGAFVEAALFNLVAGLAAMAAATVTGLWDYHMRLGAAPTARRLARWHALVNAVATALFVASLALRWRLRGAPTTPRVPFVLSGLGLAVLAVAHYLAGLVDYELAATTRRRSPDAR